MIISVNDMMYNKSVIHSHKEQGQSAIVHDFILRSLICKKEPLKQFESALLHFPIIELSLQTNYTPSLRADKDHYKVLEARDYDDYVRILREYSTKQVKVHVKLNIPSLGTINPTREKSLYLPLLMQSYLLNSPIPIMNYQRSQMKFIDDIMQEYVNGGKIDISSRVSSRQAKCQANSQASNSARFYRSQVRENSDRADLRNPRIKVPKNPLG